MIELAEKIDNIEEMMQTQGILLLQISNNQMDNIKESNNSAHHHENHEQHEQHEHHEHHKSDEDC
jgi:hypothetical protein